MNNNAKLEDAPRIERLISLAERIIANSPLAVRESRQVLLATSRLSDEESFAISNQALSRVTHSTDFREGLAAFIEKRPPQWRGQ